MTEEDDWDAYFGRPAETPAGGGDPALLDELRRLIEDGSADGLKRLLELNGSAVDLDRRDENGRTPLMQAAARGDAEIVRSLLAAGARPNLTDTSPSGWSALVYAVRSPAPGNAGVLSALVDGGADIDQPCGRNHRTPLMHAAEADVYTETATTVGFAPTTRTLIGLGARLEARDRQGHTVWHQTKRNALGARTSSAYRRRLHQMLRVLEHAGAQPIASHLV